MKILFITEGSENRASSRTRVYQYLPFLQSAGIQYKVFSILEWGKPLIVGSRLKKANPKIFLERRLGWFRQILAVMSARNYDIVFIQKVLFPPMLLELLTRMGKPYLFDFDDAIYITHQFYRNRGTLMGQLRSYRESIVRHRWKHVMKTSQCVILENNHNKELAGQYNKNTLVITGPIDISRYSPRITESNDNRVVIGWIGSPPNTIYLRPLFSVFIRLAKAYPQIVFEFIGAHPFDLPGVNMRFLQWSLDTEVENLHHFDIGIMPVPDDEWSRGKGGYKLLQYMALGIPSIGSPVGINTKLINEGETGYLASTDEEWFQKLTKLILDPEIRKNMGQKARNLVVSKYSFEVAAPRLISALSEVLTDKAN